MSDTIKTHGEFVPQYAYVNNFDNWTTEAKESITSYGQIAFVPSNTSSYTAAHLFANGVEFGNGAESNKVVTTSHIMVDGGPLADEVKSKFPDGIPAGTDLQNLLMALFCKILYPKNIERNSTADASFSIAAPSIEIKNGNTSLKDSYIYEVGTSVTFSSSSAAKYTVDTPTRYVKNMEYGYTIYDAETSSYIGGSGKQYSKTWEDKTEGDIEYTNEVTTASGFNNKLSSDLKETAVNSAATISASEDITITTGTNSVTVKNTGTGNFTASIDPMPAIKVNANNGEQPEKDDDNVSAISYDNVAADTVTATSVDKSTTFKLYGIYPIKFNANSCNYSNKGSDVVDHDGSQVNKFVPSGKYVTSGQNITLYLGFGNSTAGNTTGDTQYKLWIPANITVSNFSAKLFDETLANCWDSTNDAPKTTSDTSLDGVSYKLYNFNVSGVGTAGIKVSFTWKF